ncbi:MAG: sodium:solute symporter [Putridiphycobacter sp.]
MSSALLISILVGYFLVLLTISFLTSKGANNETFYSGNYNSKWYVVAFGMIGATLSGVTFISIPGTIEGNGFTYMQIALGYILGYIVIAFVLLPLYYKLRLISIYQFLEGRFGVGTYKMGAAFFMVSRLIGAGLRLYLVADILQVFVFHQMGVPFWVTVTISILLIWVYTFRGGIKTIVWTDTLQTLFMLLAVGLSVYYIAGELGLGLTEIYQAISDNGMGEVWQTEDVNAKNYWIKGLLAGMFLTMGMTGVDQDMIQKNLSIKTLKDSQKNMMVFSTILLFVNLVFLALGGLLFIYLHENPGVMNAWVENASKNDRLFPTIALQGGLPLAVGIFFFLGLIAAAYSSADSALTSLTTSFSVDFLNVKSKPKDQQVKLRKLSHVFMSVCLLVIILVFNSMENDDVIWKLFSAANYTYGPLLGLFMFGIISNRQVKDELAIVISILVPVFLYWLVESYLPTVTDYKFNSELLGINAGLVYLLLWVGSHVKKSTI